MSHQRLIAVALVEDLDTAIARFSELGFSVSEGGIDLQTGSRTALIPFADATAIQFVERPDSMKFRRRRRRFVRKGISARKAKSGIEHLRYRAFISCERVQPGLIDVLFGGDSFLSRVRDRSQKRAISWHEAHTVPKRRAACDHPATIYVPSLALRTVPSVVDCPVFEKGVSHANGSGGIYFVEIAANEYDRSVEVFADLCGQGGNAHDDPAGRRHRFDFDELSVAFVPVDSSLEAGVREIGLRAGFPGHNVEFDHNRTCGIEMHIRYNR